MSGPLAGDGIVIRPTRPEDGAAVHALVGRIGTLELNTPYCYALLCDHFRATCVVAERGGALVGLVVGYRPPTRPEAIFVWQVGVAPEARRLGLGQRLLSAFVETEGARGARFLEATVDAQNHASRRLFAAFAKSRHVELVEQRGYDAAHLPPEHPAEPLLRIGPLSPPSMSRIVQESR